MSFTCDPPRLGRRWRRIRQHRPAERRVRRHKKGEAEGQEAQVAVAADGHAKRRVHLDQRVARRTEGEAPRDRPRVRPVAAAASLERGDEEQNAGQDAEGRQEVAGKVGVLVAQGLAVAVGGRGQQREGHARARVGSHVQHFGPDLLVRHGAGGGAWRRGVHFCACGCCFDVNWVRFECLGRCLELTLGRNFAEEMHTSFRNV